MNVHAGLLDLARRADDRGDLHVHDAGEVDAEAGSRAGRASGSPRASRATFLSIASFSASSGAFGFLQRISVTSTMRSIMRRQELVQRRVDQADRDRPAAHRLEDAHEVLALHREQLVERRLADRLVVGKDHVAHERHAVGAEEHVLSAAEADALRAECDRLSGMLGRVGVGADAQLAELVGPRHERAEVAGDAWRARFRARRCRPRRGCRRW